MEKLFDINESGYSVRCKLYCSSVFDPLNQNYCSRRYPIYAANGMVNCSNPLAASAGFSVLQKGGNAMDAAVAAATTLTVVEPTSNGLGSSNAPRSRMISTT